MIASAASPFIFPPRVAPTVPHSWPVWLEACLSCVLGMWRHPSLPSRAVRTDLATPSPSLAAPDWERRTYWLFQPDQDVSPTRVSNSGVIIMQDTGTLFIWCAPFIFQLILFWKLKNRIRPWIRGRYSSNRSILFPDLKLGGTFSSRNFPGGFYPYPPF